PRRGHHGLPRLRLRRRGGLRPHRGPADRVLRRLRGLRGVRAAVLTAPAPPHGRRPPAAVAAAAQPAARRLRRDSRTTAAAMPPTPATISTKTRICRAPPRSPASRGGWPEFGFGMMSAPGTGWGVGSV